eukprot:7696533-Pyramimonas_sp.AAC.1
MQDVHGFPSSTCQTWCFERVQDYAGAAVMQIRSVGVPRMVFWHDPGLSRRTSQVDPWRWNPEKNVLACFRVFERLSSKEAGLSMEMNSCRGL